MLIKNRVSFTVFTQSLGNFIEKVLKMPKIEDFTVNQEGKEAFSLTFTCYIQPFEMDKKLNEICEYTGTKLFMPPLFTATYQRMENTL